MNSVDMIRSASGDLRNVIHTVNGLPEDYKGTLSMVINDFNPQIVCRNYLVLMILGLIEDIVRFSASTFADSEGK